MTSTSIFRVGCANELKQDRCTLRTQTPFIKFPAIFNYLNAAKATMHCGWDSTRHCPIWLASLSLSFAEKISSILDDDDITGTRRVLAPLLDSLSSFVYFLLHGSNRRSASPFLFYPNDHILHDKELIRSAAFKRLLHLYQLELQRFHWDCIFYCLWRTSFLFWELAVPLYLTSSRASETNRKAY